MIAIMSAGVKKDEAGRWVSTGWEDADFAFGSPGGKMRVVAACSLLNRRPEEQIFAPGGRGHGVRNDEPGRPDLCDIIKAELIELGVEAGKVVTEHAANNTFQQLAAIAKYVETTADANVFIVSNEFHQERVKVMVEYFPQLAALKTATLVNAEDILVEGDKNKWGGIVRSFSANPKMKDAVAREKKGIADIQSGKYRI